MRQKSYCKVITNSDRCLLQNILGINYKVSQVLQGMTKVYCKVRPLLQSVTGIAKRDGDRRLLEKASDITKFNTYYKTGDVKPFKHLCYASSLLTLFSKFLFLTLVFSTFFSNLSALKVRVFINCLWSLPFLFIRGCTTLSLLLML